MLLVILIVELRRIGHPTDLFLYRIFKRVLALKLSLVNDTFHISIEILERFQTFFQLVDTDFLDHRF